MSARGMDGSLTSAVGSGQAFHDTLADQHLHSMRVGLGIVAPDKVSRGRTASWWNGIGHGEGRVWRMRRWMTASLRVKRSEIGRVRCRDVSKAPDSLFV
jgi:hypothetical protein